jgi:hypothetical protein
LDSTDLANTEKRKASSSIIVRDDSVTVPPQEDNRPQEAGEKLMSGGNLMKIKHYISVVLVVGLTGIQAAAQRVPSRPAQLQRLTASERSAAINTSIEATCRERAPRVPRALAHDARVFSPDRIARTLNGVWIGRVTGEYDPQLLARDGALNVDYYMIVDVNRGESFVYQEFGSKRSGASLRPKARAPVWTYTWCARDNYKTKSPRQVHTFTKVSDNVDDARDILANSTGLRFSTNEKVVLSDVWRKLVDAKFFDNPQRSLAYAGVLFNPLTMGSVASAGGGSLFELRLVGEYRGSGQTAAKFAPGQPIHNVEQGHFLGLSMASGDFLSSSVGLGNQMVGPKSDFDAAVFSTQMAFDKVVIGPLAPGASAHNKPRR